MRFLIVSPFFPYPLISGGHTRLFHLIRQYAANHEVDFISPVFAKEKENIKMLAPYCRHINLLDLDELGLNRKQNFLHPTRIIRNCRRLFSLTAGTPWEISGFYFPQLKSMIHKMLETNAYDVVQLELTRMAQYFDHDFFSKNHSVKVLDDYDLTFVPHLRRYECETRPLHRMIRYWDYRLNKNYAIKVWRFFDIYVVMSEIDRKKAETLCPGLHVITAPNGVAAGDFSPLPTARSDKRIMYIGGALHYANIDALFYFCREIYPLFNSLLEDATIHVVGTGWQPYQDQLMKLAPIVFHGFVDDVRNVLSKSTVFIAPIRIGGGTRLKILEAMAMKLPIISTSIGCEGLPVENEANILIGDTPNEFAIQTRKLFSDPVLFKRISSSALGMVQKQFDWQGVAAKLIDACMKKTSKNCSNN